MNPPKKHPPLAMAKTAQPKATPTALTRKPPVAPAIYRPQPVPRVLQTKSMATVGPLATKVAQAQVAPPIYRPERRQIVQPKAVSQLRSAMTPASAFRPQLMLNVVQRAKKEASPDQTTATATGDGRYRGDPPLTRTKTSGKGGKLKYKLLAADRRSDARRFYSALELVNNKRGGNPWHAYDCAEAKVVGALLLAGSPIDSIRITEIKQGGKDAYPCKNCRQWLSRSLRVNLAKVGRAQAGGGGGGAAAAAAPPPALVPPPAPAGGGGGGGAAPAAVAAAAAGGGPDLSNNMFALLGDADEEG